MNTMQALTGRHFYPPLHFVETHAGYSVYEVRQPRRRTVLLRHGDAAEVYSDEHIIDNLADLYTVFMAESDGASWDFHDWLADHAADPSWIHDEIRWCARCTSPHHNDDLQWVNGAGFQACNGCIGYYWWCSGCEEYATEGSGATVSEVWRCQVCLDEWWSFCDICDQYYLDEDDHSHSGDGCCESPAMQFVVRNDGHPLLANDTRVTVSLGKGDISDVGVYQIGELLRVHAAAVYKERIEADCSTSELIEAQAEYNRICALSWQVPSLGYEWQTKQGNYPKRLSRMAYKAGKISLPPTILSEVGNIARAHSGEAEFHIETTRDLNMDRSEFFHSGSCWWSEYAESRCALKTNGGFGLRTFDDNDRVNGRAWVMPMRKVEEIGTVPRGFRLEPTFDTETPDAYVVFNGYGKLSGYAPARLMAHMSGWTYRKVEFECAPMYVNSESGYVIAPEEIANHYTDGYLTLSVDQHADLYETERESAQERETSHV